MAQVYAGTGMAPASEGRAINTKQIFWASFLTLIAAGIGFAVRGGILGDWGAQFGFTKSELGTITGGGLAGFGITIIVCSFFADQIGYKALLSGAFVLHVLSAVLTLAATPVFNASGKNATYWTLYVGMFMFALGNGLCEAAINPLTATLFPKKKTHYLNILHAGWPAGLVIGAVIAYLFAGPGAAVSHLRWEILIATFLVPALWYGLIVLKEKFPPSEPHAAGLTIGDQITAVLAPMFIFLVIIHAMVGYVELGTDSWIANILNNVVGNFSLLLFIYISGVMFVLRFFAGPIIHRINPLGLLFVAACCGALGLFMLGSFKTGAMLVVAGTIFALGKTFYWPTMLGVAGERFPRSGALGMGLLGGFGMMSAGFLGGPGIGYKQDRNASAYLKDDSKYVEVYDRYKADKPNHFLFFREITGLNAAKVGVLADNGATLASDIKALEKSGKKLSDDENLSGLNAWWLGTDPAVTRGVALAGAKAEGEVLAQGADAAKLKKADDAAAKAKADAEKDKADAAATELAAANARNGVLAEGADAAKVKKADEASTSAQTAARTAATATGAKLGALAYADHDDQIVKDANIYGGQRALQITAGVPVTMAICYLLLVLYFVSKGGYKQIHITGEQASGGVEGPQEH
jgi:MFS family permease